MRKKSRSEGPPAAVVAFYQAVLRLYPSRFRRKHAQEMIETVRGEWVRRTGRGGWRGVVSFFGWLTSDVLRSLPAQHVASLRGTDGVRNAGTARLSRVGGRGWNMDSITQDLRHATRWFVQRPGFTAIIVSTLALGIGANSALFSVVNGILLRELPYDGAERLVSICEAHRPNVECIVASTPNAEDWSERSRTLEDLGIWRSRTRILKGDNGAEGVRGGLATPGFFSTLRLQPALGRLFVPEDLEEGRNHVVVLDHDYWSSRFGQDPAIVGRNITLDSESYEVVGVLRPNQGAPLIAGGTPRELWTPLHFDPRDPTQRSWRGFFVVGRLAPLATLDQAREELTALQAELTREYSDVNEGWTVGITSLHDRVVGPVRSTLLIFLGAVAFVLLIACTNIANLMLVGVSGRRRELAVRAALGADRLRIARLLLVEGLVLSSLGGLGGIVLARWGVDAFKALAPSGIPRLEQVSLDPPTLVFALGLSLLTTLLFGLVPALAASNRDVGAALKGATKDSTRTRPASGLRGALVISEIALALVLLIGAGLLIRSFTVLQRWDPGFDTDGLATAWLLAPMGTFETDQEVTSFFREARARLATLPSVLSTGTASAGPAFGGGDGSDEFFTEGEQAVDAAGHPANWFDVGPGYFKTMGISIVLGRAFADDDDHDSPQVVMVNETMARRLWPGESPLGRLIRQKGVEAPREVVGVVADVRPFDPDAPMESEIYWPQAQSVRFATYVILRTSSSPETLLRPIEDRLRAFDPDLRVSGFATMDDLVTRQLVRPRFNMTLIGAFGILSLILSAVGIYGVVSRSVTSRTREIGVRMALGAKRTTVLGGVVREGMALGILGVLLGIVMALGLTRLLTGMLHGIVPTDVLTFSTVSGTLLVVTLLSCLIPAMRASRVDPLTALRDD